MVTIHWPKIMADNEKTPHASSSASLSSSSSRPANAETPAQPQTRLAPSGQQTANDHSSSNNSNSNGSNGSNGSNSGGSSSDSSGDGGGNGGGGSSAPPPPIITYPEFLSHARHRQRRGGGGAPPLATARRVVNALYVAGGVAVSVYGVSQYVVAPMLASLAAARHALAATTLAGLEQFNARLEQMVTVVPPAAIAAAAASASATKSTAESAAKSGKNGGGGDGDGGGDSEGKGGGEDDTRSDSSSDSDPTELFHIDAGTQTTPSLAASPRRRPPSPLSLSEEGERANDGNEDDDSGTARMQRLRQELFEARAVADRAADADAYLAHRVADFAAYLDALPASSSSNNASSNTLLYQQRTVVDDGSGGSGGSGGGGGGALDAVVATKKEIRGIKSILLNAKNFPSLSSSSSLGGGSGRMTSLSGRRSPVT